MKVIISVGGRFHAFDLAKQLQKRNFLYRLITSHPKFSTRKFGILDEKVRSVLIKEIIQRGWLKTPFLKNINPDYWLNNLYDKIASESVGSPDIFVGWSSFSLDSLRVARKNGAKIIIEHCSSHVEYQRDVLREEFEKFGLRPRLAHPKIIEKELQEFKEADYIAIPSKYVKKTFLDKGMPEEKLIHVPYGVDLSRFYQIPKEDNKFRVVFAGGMMLRKGVHYLLQAFSELNLPNSELLLIGNKNSEIEPFFKKYEGSYRWIGHIPQGELYKYYSQGSVFAIMSIEEGLAYVQAQAMACGLPVIATVNTGGEDIIREGKDGFIIPIRDVGKLKEKLLYMYENKDKCSEMGKSAKEHVLTGFSWDDYGDKIVAEYERILK